MICACGKDLDIPRVGYFPVLGHRWPMAAHMVELMQTIGVSDAQIATPVLMCWWLMVYWADQEIERVLSGYDLCVENGQNYDL